MVNLYMAFVCQEKRFPLDRKEARDIIRPRMNDTLAAILWF